MAKKIQRFDGGGGVGGYGDSWADLTADEPVNTGPQTIYPSDGSDPSTLTGAPEPTGALSHLTPQQQEAVTTEIDNQNNSVQDPNLAGHLQPRTDVAAAPAEEGVLTKLAKGLGIYNKDGKMDYADPKVMQNLLKVLSVGGAMLTTLNGPQGKKSATELQAQLKGPFDSFNPAQQASANAYFNSPAAPHTLAYARNGASLVPGKRYAEGGPVDDSKPEFHSEGALSAYVRGHTGGQDDVVPARLGHGEYVWDADAVSAIGDGNNEAGAHILDKWREELRKHKRSAPPESIPPRFKGVNAYMSKGAK